MTRTHRVCWTMVAIVSACAPHIAVAADPSHAALIAAAKQAPVKNLDFPSDYCDSETAIEIWLKGLVGAYARSITWTGGKCQLVNNINPLDAAAWPYCAQATITLVHPKAHGDRPMIEIYMERPQDGHPGEVYAFRSLMMTKDVGPDYCEPAMISRTSGTTVFHRPPTQRTARMSYAT